MSLSSTQDALRTPTPNFDRLARFYRWMEWLSFGPWLWWCRRAFLPQLLDRRRALVLGDGDGRFTGRLLQINPAVEIHAVDSSPVMLSELVHRSGPNRSRVQIHVADLRAWSPPSSDYDLIVTHFFLDCLSTEEVAALAARIRPRVQSQALWLVSEFDEPPGWIGHALAHPLISFLYTAFRWLTGLQTRRLPAYREALTSAGFMLKAQRPWLSGILVSELWEFRPTLRNRIRPSDRIHSLGNKRSAP